MLPGTDSLFAKLTFNNSESFSDFLFVHRCAVATEEKLGNVSRNRILALEFADQILAHHVAFVGPRRDRVYCIQLLAHRVSFQGWWPESRSPAPSHPARQSPPVCQYRHHLRGRL